MYVHVKDVYNLIKTRVYTSHKKNIAWKICMILYRNIIYQSLLASLPPYTSIKNGAPYNIPPEVPNAYKEA